MKNDLLKTKAYSLAQQFLRDETGFYALLEAACAGLSTIDAFKLTRMAQIYYNFLQGVCTKEECNVQMQHAQRGFIYYAG